jgi:flavin reductase ActVB
VEASNGADGELKRQQTFMDAMSSFPSGVTIVTTTDTDGTSWGFTASAFCSLSANPPLVLVCLAKSAQCYDAFTRTGGWMIHVIHNAHRELAIRFATRGADKFVGGDFSVETGLPTLEQSAAIVRCSRYAMYDGGDHSILVGRAEEAMRGDQSPVVYFNRTFHSVPGEWESSGNAPAETRDS